MNFDEGFADRVQRRARKNYACDLCHGTIRAGQEYIRQTGMYCGSFYDEKTHVHCDALALAYLGGGAEEYSGQAIKGWIGNAVCPGCPERGRCGLNPFECRKAIERMVPEMYRDAALKSLEDTKRE